MTDLIKGLVQVRDALTLIAFLALVLLVAFRTPKVPELFFGLVRNKLTRDQFSRLLRRFMLLGFLAFVALAILAALSQILNSRTQPGSVTLDDLRKELGKLQDEPADKKLHAESTFATGEDLLSKKDFDGAIAALKESFDAVPTLTAQETLALLYKEKGDSKNAGSSWEVAMNLARKRNDSLAQARLDRILTSHSTIPQKRETDLIGDSNPLPKGGDRYETAPEILPGFYNCAADCNSMFKIALREGQTLHVHMRSGNGLAGIDFFNTNGQLQTDRARVDNYQIATEDWLAPADGWYFLGIWANGPGAVYRISVH